MCAPGSGVTPAAQMKRNDIRENCLIVAQITGSGNRARPVSALTFLSGRFKVKGESMVIFCRDIITIRILNINV